LSRSCTGLVPLAHEKLSHVHLHHDRSCSAPAVHEGGHLAGKQESILGKYPKLFYLGQWELSNS
jgi:hypothetical protein